MGKQHRVTENTAETAKNSTLVILGRRIPLPKSVFMRRLLGGTLVAGGFLGFLPILGFWMLPLGLIVLSHDSHRVRRLRRRSEVHIGRKWRRRRTPAPPA